MAQLCGLFDDHLQDFVEVEPGTSDGCKRATERRKRGGVALLFSFDRTILSCGGEVRPAQAKVRILGRWR
jgi:hypothetical protein